MVKQMKLHNCYGKDLGVIDLDENIFGIEPNIHVMHLALKRQINNSHPSTASTKTRSEVRGGGKKPWKQKGTGRARAGSIRSPLFVGGGVIFGPKPGKAKFSIPKKARRLALKSALSSRTDDIKVVKDFSDLKNHKTKEFVKMLNSLEVEGKILIISERNDSTSTDLELSSRNLPNVKLIVPHNINIKDILMADKIIITESAIKEITERLS